MKPKKTTVINDNDLTPTDFFLSQNYPNPFSERTTIKYCLPYRTDVKIEVFDDNGQLIKKLTAEEKPAGSYMVEFDASELVNGNYTLKFGTSGFIETKEMILLRHNEKREK